MKTISIKLRQDPDAHDKFVVQSFENTTELSIGDVLTRNQLTTVLRRPYVKIAVLGFVQVEETEGDGRADIGALIEKHDGQPF